MAVPAIKAVVSEHALKILVAEDHADTRTMLQMFLSLLGHRCDLACDADGALTRAAASAFDVLLTDVHMPRMDGWELVQELRARGHLPAHVISMSAGLVEEPAQSQAAGCHAHLVKPFRVNELEAALALSRA